VPEVRIAAEFLASYPDAKVDLTMGERTIDLIDEGFDLAIRPALPPDSSLIVRSLATWRHVLCCSPAYLEKYGPPQQLSELAETQLRSPFILSVWGRLALRRPERRAGVGAGLRH